MYELCPNHDHEEESEHYWDETNHEDPKPYEPFNIW